MPDPLKTRKRHEANGVRIPVKGTKAAAIWKILDSLRRLKGRPPARFELLGELTTYVNADNTGPLHNLNYASKQYAAWRRFHGIPGRATGLYPAHNKLTASAASQRRVASRDN